MLLLLLACASDVPPGDDTAAADATDSADPGDTGAGDDPATAALALAEGVSQAELERTITELEALGTRYTFSEGDESAADLLVARLEALGLGVERQVFDVDGVRCENLVAVQLGVEAPDEVYVFSAHYDSTSDNPGSHAPGADDNASGVAAVLEAARLLAGKRTRATAWFVLTAAEEQGSLGSAELTDRMLDEGVDARAVMAPDMIGYWPLGEGDALDILGDPASQPLVVQMSEIADALGVANKMWVDHDYCYGDDHTHFQDAGYPAISPMDCVEAHNLPRSGETTPHYHRTTDTIDTLHLGFTTRVTQVTTATFATWLGLLD